LRVETLESRLALAALMEIKVQATDLTGNPITEVEVGDEFLLTATVQDLRPEPTGVFAAYADITYDPTKVAVAAGGEVTPGPLYPNGVEGDLSTPGVINDAGAFFNCTEFPCFGDGDEELLFSIPFVATAAGTVTFDVEPPNDPTPVHDSLLFGINGAIAVEDIDFIDSTLEVTAPTPTDLLNDLRSDLESLELDRGVRNALDARLQGALQSLTSDNANTRQDGINKLNAFISYVDAQRGKKIGDADADFLIDAATTIIKLATGGSGLD
jgi:hypothetical protein